MYIIGQLKKLFAIAVMCTFAFSATATLAPYQVPVGATSSNPFMQNITITFQNNGDGGNWADNDYVIINTPSEITIADPDGDLDYDDGVYVFASAAAGALGATVDAGLTTENSIAIKLATATNIANEDVLIVIFPISVSGGSDGQVSSYSILYESATGVDVEAGGELANVTYKTTVLDDLVEWSAPFSDIDGSNCADGTSISEELCCTNNLGTWDAATSTCSGFYDDDFEWTADSSSSMGEQYPKTAVATSNVWEMGEPAATATLPDWVPYETKGNDDLVGDQALGSCYCSDGTDVSAFDDDPVGCLEPSNPGNVAGGAGSNRCTSFFEDAFAEFIYTHDGKFPSQADGTFTLDAEEASEMQYSMWFSTDGALTTVDENVATLVDEKNSNMTDHYNYESEGFAGLLFDHESEDNGSELIAGTLYFYLTSNWTGTWALGRSGPVVIEHEADIVIDATDGSLGFDYDDSDDYDGADNSAGDSKTDIYLDSNVKSRNIISRSGEIKNDNVDDVDGTMLNEIDLYFDAKDVDSDLALVKVFFSETGASCLCGGGLGSCTDDSYVTEAECETAGEIWTRYLLDSDDHDDELACESKSDFACDLDGDGIGESKGLYTLPLDSLVSHTLIDTISSCSDDQYLTEESCTGEGTCSQSYYDNDEEGCLSIGTCTENVANEALSYYKDNEEGCLKLGTCSNAVFNNDKYGCENNPGGGDTWTAATTWAASNTFTSAGNTWTQVSKVTYDLYKANAITDSVSYHPAGSHYVYVQLTDGVSTNTYQVKNNIDDTNAGDQVAVKVHTSHYPSIEFDDIIDGSANLNTETTPFQRISWAADNVDGDFFVESENAYIDIYASDLNYEAAVGDCECNDDNEDDADNPESDYDASKSACEDADATDQASAKCVWQAEQLTTGSTLRNDMVWGDCTCNGDDEDDNDVAEATYDNDRVACETAPAVDQPGNYCMYDDATYNDGSSGTKLVAHIKGDSDSKSDNQVMFDVRNSGLAASTYYFYAFASDGSGTCSGASTYGREDDIVQPLTEELCLDPAGDGLDNMSGDGSDNRGTWTPRGALYQYKSTGSWGTSADDNDRSVAVLHGETFLPLTPAAGVNQKLTSASSYDFRWKGAGDAASFLVHIVLSPTSDLVTDWTTFGSVADHWWVNSDNGDDDGTGTITDIDVSGEPFDRDQTYTLDVSKLDTDADGNNPATPEGVYYVYYFYSEDGAFSDNEFPYQADGTIEISTDDEEDEDISAHFELSPNSPVVSMNDTITFNVMAKDLGHTSELLSYSVNFDNTYFSIVDQTTGICTGASSDGDGNFNTGTYFPETWNWNGTAIISAGSQPSDSTTCLDPALDGWENSRSDSLMSDDEDDIPGVWVWDKIEEVSTTFDGEVLYSEVIDNGDDTSTIKWASFLDNGDDLGAAGAAPVSISSFKLRVLQNADPSSSALLEKAISFNSSGTAMINADNEITESCAGAESIAGTVDDPQPTNQTDCEDPSGDGDDGTAYDGSDVGGTWTEISSGATVYVTPGGILSGLVDLQGRSSSLSGQTVNIDVCPLGSYFPSYGGSITLGDGGSYSVSEVSPGLYTVVVSKDGYLTQVVDNVKIIPFAETTVNFSNDNDDDVDVGNSLLGGDVVGWIDASGRKLPDNSIGGEDATAITNAFGATSDDPDWNEYADVDGSGQIYIEDLNYAAENKDASLTPEGPVYKMNEADNFESEVSLNILSENKVRSLFVVKGQGINSLHAYAIEMYINSSEWEVISVNDNLKDNGDAIDFTKSNGNYLTAGSALFGKGSVSMSDLLVLELKPLVNKPASPIIEDITLIDDQNRSNKSDINNNGQVMPTKFELSQNFPNPFNPMTNIAFAIPRDGFVKLTIYNLLGKEVRQLVSAGLKGGNYSATWNSMDHLGRQVSSGLYLYSLSVDNQMVATHKMILMK